MISVCVLSYERPEFLRRSLWSMIETADQPLEIIVHDDGSENEAVRLFLNQELREGRVSRIILNPPGHNEGQGVALNRMFNMARGEIICKADQDLIYKPGWTKAISDTFAANEGSGIDPEGPPCIGALGLFKYHHEPVRHADMYLRSWEQDGVRWDEVRDFVGSFFAVPRHVWGAWGPFEEHSLVFDEDAIFKQQLFENHVYCNALTPEDYIENIGFGLGRSTLVKDLDKEGNETLAEIKTEPHLVEPRRASG